jgi:hypothetical protein
MVKSLILLLPIIGLILLNSNYTNADLIDEVSVNANTLKATTLSISIQNTIDNTQKPYIFNINKFQKGSLDATTIRIRNTGKEKTKYFLNINSINNNEVCQQPTLKILKDDKIIYSDKIINLNLEMSEINSNEKNDLIFLLSLNENINQNSPTPCEYQLNINTKINPQLNQGLFDSKKIASQIQIL